LVEAEVKHDQKMETNLKTDVQIMEFAPPERSENTSSTTGKEQYNENVNGQGNMCMYTIWFLHALF
jgi:hypothetical protein